jgi:hypothetical protein
MNPHDGHHCHVGRGHRWSGAVRAASWAAVAAWGAIAALSASFSAQACGYHDPSGYNVGMLNWAYPDALHVRTAVWMAQRDGSLAPAPSLPAFDPASSQARLWQMLRLGATQAQLGALRASLDATVAGRPLPAFAVVLIGPMLWTRFDAADDGVRMAAHIPGPAPGDVVVVTDAAVLAALVDGSITFHSARERGLARLYGSSDAVERVSNILDATTPSHRARHSQLVDPVQED